ncbi:peptidyl-prolyl cis-trans isomerase [Pendulispora rubella]|uniref:Peptidyl-prolyl cis-trans isomerase n=1 Tax=Pendulispora rubella TaxID=2741070 RepID=A0ABZ2KTJ0_9BACT
MHFPRLLREPVVQFLLAGAVLFGADRVRRREEPPKKPSAECAPETTVTGAGGGRIVVTDELRQTLSEEHQRVHGRPPTPAEMDTLVAGWVNEEVLYREGLARGLEKDDPRIRQRVVEKMSFVLDQRLEPPAPSDAELAAWFDAHPNKWATSELVDFTHVFVQGNDDAVRARARGLLGQLETGTDPAGMGDTFSGGRRYRRRSLADLGESFGPDFSAGLAEQKEGTWSLRQSRFGVHLVRVDRRTPAERPALAQVREDVLLDYREAKRAAAREGAIAEMRKRWTP